MEPRLNLHDGDDFALDSYQLIHGEAIEFLNFAVWCLEIEGEVAAKIEEFGRNSRRIRSGDSSDVFVHKLLTKKIIRKLN